MDHTLTLDNLMNKLIIKKIIELEWLLLDVDGVLTDGTIMYNNNGEEIKSFNVKDGYGIMLLKKNGIKIGAISGRGGNIIEKRLNELKFDWYSLNRTDKDIAFNEALRAHGNSIKNSAFIGDDLLDLCIFNLVSIKVAVANAVDDVKKNADIVLAKSGGNGAVREFCDLILKIKKDKFIQ